MKKVHTDKVKASYLYHQVDKYYLMDTRWQNNYRRKVDRLAKKYSPSATDVDEQSIVIRIDIINMKLNRHSRWAE